VTLPYGRRRRERELDEEIRAHFRMAVEERVARGQSRDEAERAVRREFGNEARVREVTRTMWGGLWMDRLAQDVRFGLRVLRRDPAFAILTVLTFALGVGVSTAIFSAAEPVLISALDYPQAGRLFVVHDLTSEGDPMDVTFGTFREVAERSRSFDALGVARGWQPSLGGADVPERLEGQSISAGYFSALGVRPMLGRDIQASDDQSGGPRVVVLSHALWQRRFSSDRAIVGRSIRLDDRAHTVIGVMESDFVDVLHRPAEIWRPLQYDTALPVDGREWGHHRARCGDGRAPLALPVRPPRRLELRHAHGSGADGRDGGRARGEGALPDDQAGLPVRARP
jgi:putative ABC transport system permease protein